MFLRMKPIYIQRTKQGLKTATTRMKMKKFGEYELITGSFYKPIKSGIKVKITKIATWCLKTISPEMKKAIADAENFPSFDDLVKVLRELNPKMEITDETLFYTHFYNLINPL